MYENIIYDVEGRIGYLTLNRPQRLNALSTATMEEIEAAMQVADDDGKVRVVVVRGAGSSFCAGYDLVSRRGDLIGEQETDDPAEIWSDLYRLHDAQRRNGEWWLKVFFNLRKPVIAQVHGHCLAGGMDLLGVCDLVVAATDAKFGLPQSRGVGVIHTMGLLPFLIGLRRTNEMCFTGDSITGSEAADIGLINKAVPAEHLEAETRWLAERVSYMPKEMLAAHKFAIHRFYELMGVDTAVKSAGEYDALAVQNPMLEEFRQRAERDGMKAALAWRDAPWRDQPDPEWRE